MNLVPDSPFPGETLWLSPEVPITENEPFRPLVLLRPPFIRRVTLEDDSTIPRRKPIPLTSLSGTRGPLLHEEILLDAVEPHSVDVVGWREDQVAILAKPGVALDLYFPPSMLLRTLSWTFPLEMIIPTGTRVLGPTSLLCRIHPSPHLSSHTDSEKKAKSYGTARLKIFWVS